MEILINEKIYAVERLFIEPQGRLIAEMDIKQQFDVAETISGGGVIHNSLESLKKQNIFRSPLFVPDFNNNLKTAEI
jgi:hypothetical protein